MSNTSPVRQGSPSDLGIYNQGVNLVDSPTASELPVPRPHASCSRQQGSRTTSGPKSLPPCCSQSKKCELESPEDHPVDPSPAVTTFAEKRACNTIKIDVHPSDNNFQTQLPPRSPELQLLQSTLVPVMDKAVETPENTSKAHIDIVSPASAVPARVQMLHRQNSGRNLRLKHVKAEAVDSPRSMFRKKKGFGNDEYEEIRPTRPKPVLTIQTSHSPISMPSPASADDSHKFQFELWKNAGKREIKSDEMIVFGNNSLLGEDPVPEIAKKFTRSHSCEVPSNQRYGDIDDMDGSVSESSSGMAPSEHSSCDSPTDMEYVARRFEAGMDLHPSSYDLIDETPEVSRDFQIVPSLSPAASLRSRRRPTLSFSEQKTCQWKKGELLGEGTFGKVYMALNEVTGELFAVKEIEMSFDRGNGNQLKVQKLEEEISLMKELNHKHIVRYFGTHRRDRELHICMEYIPGGSIASMLSQFGVFNEDLIRLYVRQILEGIEYLHSKGIIHRDIKGANVLVNEQGVAKLADFGCSKQLDGVRTHSLEESLKSIRGSVPWMAPEVIKQTGHDFKADIWSIGATVVEMATAKHPWPAFTNNLSVMYGIATTTTCPPLPDDMSDDLKLFLDRCFEIEPEDRATASEMLQHHFLLPRV